MIVSRIFHFLIFPIVIAMEGPHLFSATASFLQIENREGINEVELKHVQHSGEVVVSKRLQEFLRHQDNLGINIIKMEDQKKV